MQLVKQLLREGYQVTIWDESVLLGRLVASKLEYIENTIPHIGSLLCQDFSEVLNGAEVVVTASGGIKRDELQGHHGPKHFVADLVNLEKIEAT